uniref:Cadherin domain-containing protein n=1 Tax=Amphimedon queenslandica TaxID=400682 RepID=A0A1X7TN46_AMPQE
LVAGKYGLEALVYDDEGNYGRDFVNITVRPEPHVNKAPIVIISPSTNITIKPSDKLILDASSCNTSCCSPSALLTFF